ncbi:MAG: helix-turn-helix domain-containing protein [Pseudomonadota bacterium]
MDNRLSINPLQQPKRIKLQRMAMMKTLDLKQAAAFLKMHPVTVQAKARAGEIPAAKHGKCWAFIKDDLVSYLRSLYSSKWRTLEGDTKEDSLCHFTSVRTPPSGGFVSPTKESEYSKALALPSASKRKSTKPS